MLEILLFSNDDFICRFCDHSDKRVQDLKDIKKLSWFSIVDWDHIRDRPAAFPVIIKSIDDTDNFDEFPDVELKFSKLTNTENAEIEIKIKYDIDEKYSNPNQKTND